MSSADPARSLSVPIDRRDRDTLERAAAALRSGRALSLRSRDAAVADAAERIVQAFDAVAARASASAGSPERHTAATALDELQALVRDDRATSALQRLRHAISALATT
jgi:hypothetical protein